MITDGLQIFEQLRKDMLKPSSQMVMFSQRSLAQMGENGETNIFFCE